MKNIKKINPILAALLAFSARILYFGASYQDAPILAIIAALYFGLKFIKIKEDIISENKFRTQVNNELSSLKTTITSINFKSGGNQLGGRR